MKVLLKKYFAKMLAAMRFMGGNRRIPAVCCLSGICQKNNRPDLKMRVGGLVHRQQTKPIPTPYLGRLHLRARGGCSEAGPRAAGGSRRNPLLRSGFRLKKMRKRYRAGLDSADSHRREERRHDEMVPAACSGVRASHAERPRTPRPSAPWRHAASFSGGLPPPTRALIVQRYTAPRNSMVCFQLSVWFVFQPWFQVTG